MKKLLLILISMVLLLPVFSQSNSSSYKKSKKVVKELIKAVNKRDLKGMYYYTIKNTQARKFVSEMRSAFNCGKFKLKTSDFKERYSNKGRSEFYFILSIQVEGELKKDILMNVQSRIVNQQWKIYYIHKKIK